MNAQSIQCLILAGGLGTRMKHLTQDLPKPLLHFHGKPFLEYQIQDLAQQGIRDIVVSIGYKGEMIRTALGSGERWNVSIQYIDEGNARLGTGGAVRFALDHAKMQSDFLVMYGDSFLQVNFNAFAESFHRSGLSMMMTVLKNQGHWDRSNVCFDGRRVTLYDKHAEPQPADMIYIDYGLLAVTSELVTREIPSGRPYDLGNLTHRLSKEGELGGFEVSQRFYEIGSPNGYNDFMEFSRSKDD